MNQLHLRQLAQSAVLIAIGCTTTGCPPRDNGVSGPDTRHLPPRNLHQIVSAIDANIAKLDRPISSSSLHVAARLRDSKGKKHNFNLDGRMIFIKPRYLWMDLRHGLGSSTVMHVGSNSDEYWAWIEPEMEQMWWGRYRNAGKPCMRKIHVRPEQMVAALGIAGLPSPVEGLVGPYRSYGRQYDILNYAAPGGRGSQRFVRQYYVDRYPPYQIRLIAFLDEYGRKEISAYLDDYRPAWRNGPMIAHAVNIVWSDNGGNFTVRMKKVSPRGASEVATSVFTRPQAANLPAKVRGNIEQIDIDCE